MKTPMDNRSHRILAVVPANRRLAFAVLEGDQLLDAGTKAAPNRMPGVALMRVHRLIAEYAPDELVLECMAPGARRALRVRALVAKIARIGEGSRLEVRHV